MAIRGSVVQRIGSGERSTRLAPTEIIMVITGG
jgi:hypothetical protein